MCVGVCEVLGAMLCVLMCVWLCMRALCVCCRSVWLWPYVSMVVCVSVDACMVVGVNGCAPASMRVRDVIMCECLLVYVCVDDCAPIYVRVF